MSKFCIDQFINIDGNGDEYSPRYLFNVENGTLIGYDRDCDDSSFEDEDATEDEDGRNGFFIASDVSLDRLMSAILLQGDNDELDPLAFDCTDEYRSTDVTKLTSTSPSSWKECTRRNVMTAWLAANSDEVSRCMEA